MKNRTNAYSTVSRLTLTTVLFSMVAPAVFSQTADDFVDLGTLVLRNQENATGPVGDDTNPPTVTGTKSPVTVNQVPQSVSILGQDDLERFNATRVSETLRYTAGVTTDVFGNDTDYDWLRIRGFQADQTGIYLDNAQNLSFAFGSFFIDPVTLERIEVLRGPSSALYGGSNPGGIVNYVSKRPGDRVRELTFGINDAAAGWVEFDYGDEIAPGRAYRFTGRIEAGDKYDAFNSGVRGTFAPSFKFTTDGGTEVTLLGNFHYADEQHSGSSFLPYAGTVTETAEFGFIDPDANFSDPDWDQYLRKQASVSAIVEHELDNGFTFTGIARLGVASVEERYFYPFGYDGFSPTPVDADGTLALIAFEHDTLVRTAQTDLRYYGTVETGTITHDLLFGLDARFYEIDEVQASNFTDTNTVVNPTNPGTPTLNPPYQDAVTHQRQVGLYFQDQLRWGDGWIGTANLRHDFVSTEQDGAAGFSRDDSVTSYRVALARELSNGFTPYASYASFFNPLIDSPASGVTEPETGEQIELGFKWAPTESNFALSAATFQIDRNNVVTGAFPNFDQLGTVRSRGFELEGEYDFGNGFRLQGAATMLDVEVTADSDATLIGTTPTLIPETQVSLLGTYRFSGGLSGLEMGVGVRMIGDSFADAANTLAVPSNTLVDLFATYEMRSGLVANFAVTNAGDKRHVTGCQTQFVCSYGSGREISMSVTSSW
ncbi:MULTISPECIES: TonB-dependent siderophore receptor [Roseobacteraceae]|uniref:Ferrichrome-iron receptor n=1 Tax=Pseudosulfitobacter pseudonitzschiae TaxID=1402135 RepID=A0A221K660_9RHOB|nr:MULTISPECIES: TonB-dependent siderophore receptor [Roseobacteraceae]ASM74491.1 ferrichrome-iron receptor [Pseudosulfitobacter pseudonitzschiae]